MILGIRHRVCYTNNRVACFHGQDVLLSKIFFKNLKQIILPFRCQNHTSLPISLFCKNYFSSFHFMVCLFISLHLCFLCEHHDLVLADFTSVLLADHPYLSRLKTAWLSIYSSSYQSISLYIYYFSSYQFIYQSIYYLST